MIRFGLRLALHGGRESAARLALTAVAVALGVGMLLAIIAAGNAVESQNQRYAWLTSGLPTAADPTAGDVDAAAIDPVWWRPRTEFFDGDQILRVDVAVTGSRSPVVPGITALPRPGEYYASPAMTDLLETTSPALLGDRYGGTLAGTVDAAALPAPDSLVIVVGRPVDDLAGSPHAVRVTSIATELPDDCGGCYAAGVIPDTGITVILAVTAVALLFPVLIFIGSATRLSAARREQRFAAMRLVGATPRQVAVIATVESAVAAVIGVVAGFALFAAARPLLAEVPFTGARFFPDDLSLGPIDIVLVAAGVPVAAAVAARLALRRVLISPLGASRRSTPGAPRAWRLIPLLAGVAELGYWYVAGRPGGTNAQLLAYLSGIVLTMVGLLVAGPWLTMTASRLMARHARTPASLIAARRLGDDPKAGFRSISGLVLALFITAVSTGVIATLAANRGAAGGPAAASTLIQRFTAADADNLPVLAQDVRDGLLATPGVEGFVVLHVDPSSSPDPGRRRLLVSCDQLAGAPMLGRCEEGAATASFMPYYGSEASDLERQAETTWPAAAYRADEIDALPAEGIYITTDGSQYVLEQARTALLLTAADGELTPMTLAEYTSSDDRFDQWQQLANVVILMTLPIAGCSLAVGVAAGLNARRRPFSLLRLTGTPLRSLQRVVALESTLPLAFGTIVSVGTGFLTGAPVRSHPARLRAPATRGAVRRAHLGGPARRVRRRRLHAAGPRPHHRARDGAQRVAAPHSHPGRERAAARLDGMDEETQRGDQFHFDPTTYLAMIRDEVPAYDEFQDAVAAASADVDAARALELGVGTGETTRRILNTHAPVELVGIDESPDMLAAASDRVAGADLRVSRLEDPLPEGSFDLVVSALAVHHLDGAGKADLFARIADRLRPGGRFVLGDVVVPDDPADVVTPIDGVYDKPSTVADQLTWLASAGLRAHVAWARQDLAVIVAEPAS